MGVGRSSTRALRAFASSVRQVRANLYAESLEAERGLKAAALPCFGPRPHVRPKLFKLQRLGIFTGP